MPAVAEMPPTFSLIVPTRQRTARLRRLFDSLAATTAHPDRVEVVLVLDDDDTASLAFTETRLPCRRTVGPPGRSMGALNQAGYAVASGRFVMLLNDDVLVRTPAWDREVGRVLNRYPDGIVLGHVNDTLMRDRLCTFPILTRDYCRLAGGVCPTDYQRYRIDDHIEDVFNMLHALGYRRTVYFPGVIFEHLNGVVMPQGHREYHADPAVLALDSPRFDARRAERKQLVLRLLDHIDANRCAALRARQAELLDRPGDPFALRLPGRQRVAGGLAARLSFWRQTATPSWWVRAYACWQQRGWRGVGTAIGRRLSRRTRRPEVTPPAADGSPR